MFADKNITASVSRLLIDRGESVAKQDKSVGQKSSGVQSKTDDERLF